MEYLTRKETAKLFRITLPTLHSWMAQGLLRGYKIGGRVLFRSDEVNKALTESREMTPNNLISLDDQTLVEAFHILNGEIKRTFPDNYKVAEMRSIFNDGTQPCVPFTNWVKCIEFLSTKLAQ